MGADGDARACIESNKKEAPAKRTMKRARRTRKERVPSRTYRWVETCVNKKEVPELCAGHKKHPKPIAIWATCKLCLYKNLNAKAYGVKTEITHCPLWTGCVKHVENTHSLHTPEEIDEAVTNPKAYWDNLEDKKAREYGWRRGIKGRARWTSACRNTSMGVLKGNVAWRTSHDCALWRICLCISVVGQVFSSS